MVVLTRLLSLGFCALSLRSKGLFSFPDPHQLEIRLIETTDLSGVSEACLQSGVFSLQKFTKTTSGEEERRQEWWLQSAEEGQAQGTDLGSPGPKKVRTRMFYLKGEEVG